MALVEVYIEHGLRVTRRYEAGNGELFEGISASSMGGFGREGGWGDRQGEAGWGVAGSVKRAPVHCAPGMRRGSPF